MLRLVDIILSLTGIVALSPLMALLYIITLFDTGSPFFIQERLGRHQKAFKLIKFRTMQIGTAQVHSHLADPSDVTPCGRFLRKTKLDELPQLLNVIKGDMSLVGPRPMLVTQTQGAVQVKMIAEREIRKVFDYRPGVTGLGQVHGVDMSTPRKLARYDALMLKNLNLCSYFYLLFLTVLGKGQGDRVK